MNSSKNPPDQKQKKEPSIFILVKILPILYVLFFLLAPLLSPKDFAWIENMRTYYILLAVMTVYQIIIYIATEVFNKKTWWKHIGYVWSVFYFIFIYITGGINSSFMFSIIFVPIISASYLDEKLSRNNGIFSTILLIILIFVTPGAYSNPVLITKHIAHIALYILMAFYIYKIVKEILYQRYEREKLERRVIELNELEKVKDMFLTAISHQLRTPLSGARWAIDVALKTDTCTNKEILEDGYKKIVEAINIVGEMIKTAEFDIGGNNLKISKVKINLADFVSSIVSNIKYLIDIKGGNFKLDVKENIDIDGDIKMLNLALSNVFDNAFRYSPGGIVKATIEKIGDTGILTVEDNGIGIDSSDMEYVFQKFFRGKNALLMDPNNSGVGLYATKKIIELHGGTIKLSSELKKGTKVEIAFPLK
jgi:signal transduction histidine kinase